MFDGCDAFGGELEVKCFSPQKLEAFFMMTNKHKAFRKIALDYLCSEKAKQSSIQILTERRRYRKRSICSKALENMNLLSASSCWTTADLKAGKAKGTIDAIKFISEIRDSWEEMGKQNAGHG